MNNEELSGGGEPSSKGKFDTLKDLHINEKGGRKYDRNKPDWSLLTLKTLKPMVKILEMGAKKYERNNWQKVEPRRYFRALIKHISEWQSGEVLDPETQESHLAHAMCNLYFLMYFEQNDKLTPEDLL